MSTFTANPYYPVFDKDVDPKTQGHFLDLYTAVHQHDQAIQLVNEKVASIVAGTQNVTNIENVTTSSGTSSLAGLGRVNMQTADYTLQSSDAGSLVTMTSVIATVITLNFTVSTPFFCYIMNFGSADVTLTPDSGALINGAATLTLPPGYSTVVFFDTQAWEATTFPPLPSSFAAVASNWLRSYNAVTGTFTASQPAFTDITGQITTAQLPASGLTVTITTAALTGLGTQGSMTFTNGILTAQTPAT